MSTPPRSYTIAEAAKKLGITEKAVRRRIERKTLSAVLGRDGRRRIPAIEVEAAAPSPTPIGADAPPGTPTPEAVALVARLESLASEVGRLRALTDGSERQARELEEALHEARARASAAEAQLAAVQARLAAEAARPWWRRRGRTPAPGNEPAEGS
jgi:excisionase family DNA binding protein